MTEIKTPSTTTVRKIFALSRNRCAYPGCQTPVVDPTTHTITAEVCHIRAQSSGGPRYDPTQSGEQRHAAANLILLCSVHHKIIDSPETVQKFTAEYLFSLKASHEAQSSSGEMPALSDALVEALVATVKRSGASTHMDFRGATLKAGGEGGQWGGGGGSGGVINIVGVAPAGFHEPIDANGQDGQAPGGGGGGAGMVVYSGRVGDESDIENGLRISSIFIANALNEQGQGLFGALGGGWARLDIPLPHRQLRIGLQSIFETGKIAPGSKLRIDYQVVGPSGKAACLAYFDLTVHSSDNMVKRYTTAFFPQFDVDIAGIWKIVLSTGGIVLVNHDFEIRAR